MVLRVTQQVEPPPMAFETAYEAQGDLSSVIGLAFEQALAKLIRFIFTFNPLRQHGEEMSLTWQGAAPSSLANHLKISRLPLGRVDKTRPP